MDPDDFELAPPSTPLGLLQRGRGAGYLWALDHPEEARPLLVDCITRDPRLDQQCDSRESFDADLALAIRLELSPLERHLREHDDADSNGGGARLAVDVLCGLARRGSAEALRLLLAYIPAGAHWSSALHAIAELGGVKEATPGAQQALEELLPLVRARFPTHARLVSALEYEWRDFVPWRKWAARDPAIAAALAEEEASFQDVQRPAPSAAGLTTRELLASPDVRSLSGALAERRSAEDTAVLLETARFGSGHAQGAALKALGARHDPRVVEPVLALLPSIAPLPKGSGWLRGALMSALSGLPANPGLGLARDWYHSDDFVLRTSAERLLVAHAEPRDKDLLRAGAVPAPGNDYRVCHAMDALRRIPQHGPYPEVRAVFEEHAFSYARSRAAAALAATDPAFPRGAAFECLWDCEGETRAIGCAHVDLAVPGAPERLHALAADPLEAEEVRDAAGRRQT